MKLYIFLKRSTKLTNPQLDQEKRKETQITKIRNERGDFIVDATEVIRILWDYYEQLYANKVDNLEEMDPFPESYNLPRLNHDEIKTPTDQ